MAEDWEAGGFGLYVHWPFCAAKCPYCDFNSHVTQSVDHDAWRNALVSEVERVGTLTKGRVLRSVFFGGGTPSLMAPKTIEAVIDAIAKTWPMANDVEVTLEANPTSVEAHKFTAFRSAGINRVSMGIQALNDPDLLALGRLHTAAEGLAAFDIARSTFDRVSLDLMYGRQNQSLTQWKSELWTALALGLDHVSLYQLTIEPGTAFGDRYKRGKLSGLPNDDLSADMYALTQDVCAEFGMPRYEVSNHAKDGAESRHNLIYWRYGDYAGIGPGAHGRLTLQGQRHATEQLRMPTAWLLDNDRTQEEALSGADQAVEFLMMGLRLTEGVDLDRYTRLANRSVDDTKIKELADLGLVTQKGRNLFVTNQGFSLLNAVLRSLLND
ncbi:coproporphyrinogen III oxidase [Tateyamaria omphalii]|uniref:radical SAM family heme chaperone HemW n=1 Tax=Tateyamaria omphalii TaxID=299262 RepID=UPI0016721DCF|nr:radical SAM family heme chaperone HemW [Tateyamaria omphalii]GGX39882.1 coproporphyrinogen III oxidase [Tateyamaria omphalii]